MTGTAPRIFGAFFIFRQHENAKRALPWFRRFRYEYRPLLKRAHSSVGQSRRLIISWSGVQVPLSPPIFPCNRFRCGGVVQKPIIRGPDGEIGRHKGLKLPRLLQLCRFESGSGHHSFFRLSRGPEGSSPRKLFRLFGPGRGDAVEALRCGYGISLEMDRSKHGAFDIDPAVADEQVGGGLQLVEDVGLRNPFNVSQGV